jgi:hypothetical protein
MRTIFKIFLVCILIFFFAYTIGFSCTIFSLLMWDKKYIDVADELGKHLIDSIIK